VARLSIKVENFANFVATTRRRFIGPPVKIDGPPGLPFYLKISKYDANMESPSETNSAKYLLGVYLYRSIEGELANSRWDRWVEIRFHIKSSRDSSADIVSSIEKRKLTKETHYAGLFRMTTIEVIFLLI
jgi:hypothetical protein